MSQTIKVFVLIFSVGVFALAGYFGFDWQVGAISLQAQNQPSNQNTGKFADDLLPPNAKRDFGSLPLYFTVNRGQADKNVKYYSVGSRYGLFLTRSGATMRLAAENAEAGETEDSTHFEKAKNFRTDEVHLNFIGADFSEPPTGEEEMPGKVNYLVGNNASQWQTNISTFAKVRYKSIYPGIDALFYGNQRELEYDFVIAARANPRRIALEFDGAEKVSINKRGELVLKVQNGEILQRKPVAYQFVDGQRREVSVRFVKQGKNRLAFRLGKYDPEKELVIDPIIIFSTYFGGSSSETATAVKTDAEGNIYLTGATISPNFPTVTPQQPTIGNNSYFDAFVTKINPAGNSVIYSTYLGGESDDSAASLDVDSGGNVLVAGRTYSPNFPTVNALQTQNGGNGDSFIAKLNSSGSALIFSTFLGGSAYDDILGATLDTNGNPVVVGRTDSGNFPTVNPFQATRAGSAFFRSINSGNSWAGGTILPEITTTSSFAVNPNSPNVVFAATNKGVFRSNDGGAVWSPAGHTDLAAGVAKIVVARSNPNVIYAVSNGVIYKSSNGGDNWTSVLGNLIAQFNTVAVDPSNADIAFIGGSGGAVYKTINGGTSWTSASGVGTTVNSIVIDPSNPQIIYVGTSQRIHKSTVGGGSWAVIMNGIPFTMTFWDLLIDSATGAIYAAGQNGLYRSTDAGANWTQINVNNLFTVRALAQDLNNSAILYAVTSAGLFFRSLDGGMSWSQSNNGLVGNSLLAVTSTSNSVLLGTYGGTDAFIARLSGSGNVLSYSTYFGGSSNDSTTSVRVDAANRITLVGTTNSADFPVSNAIQPALGGGSDAFAAKFNENGASLIYSTFLGGASTDSATSVDIDNNGNVYLTGSTFSANFPMRNALQSNCASCAAFGNDAFVTKLNSSGSALVYSTFLGGSSNENGTAIEVDSQNRAIVAGSTTSSNFPVLDAIQPAIAGGTDGFVSQIKEDGSNFVYSTYFGGSGSESVTSLTIAPEGNPIIVGQTTSFNFPVVRPIQNALGGNQDIFIAKVGIAADLEIVKIDERDPVMVNNSLIYNLRVKNNGPSAATGVVVTDVLPAGVNFILATSTQGNCAANGLTLTCNLGDLASNAQADIRLNLTPTQTGTVSSTATVKGSEPDPFSANNSDAEQTLISALPSIFGRVTDANGQAAGNININVEGFQNRALQTNAAGAYSATELPLGGNYTVRPSKSGFYFSPRSKSFNSLTRDETADFVINPCSYALSASAVDISGAGGNQSIFITANDPFCAWTATSNTPWISITGGSDGFGNGTVKISILPSSVQRTGTLTIAGQTFTVTQGGCSFTLMPFQQSFSQNGGTGTITLTANQSFCEWSAETGDSWITMTNGSSGAGNGTVSYSVAPTTRPRGGRIIIAGQSFPVYQEFDYCPAPGFGTPIESISSSESLDIVAGHFSTDTNLDLVTVDETTSQTSTFSVYSGNGNGTFNRNTIPIPSNIGPIYSLAAGDFNRDSYTDLAFVGGGKIIIYTLNSNNSITLLTSFNATTSSNSKIFTDDFNRDGKIDLLVGASNGIYLHYGNGDGTFTTGPNYPISGRYTYSFAVGDLNGDGATDVVAANEDDVSLPRLVYFFGSSVGTFSQAGTVSLGTSGLFPYSVKAADLNGDGRADVIINGIASSQILVFLWNSSANALRPPFRVFTEPFGVSRLGVADINNDGIPDIVSVGNNYQRGLSVLRGNGNGTFRPVISFTSVISVSEMTFADFNHDGRIDVAFAKETNQMAVQLNQCNSAAAASIGTTKFDFDGDRKADFAVVRPSDNTWYIHRGVNQSLVSQQFGMNEDILVPADYDGDGRTDIAVYRPAEGAWYRLNSSDNSFHAEQWGKTGDIPVPADYDGDERADLAVFRPEDKTWYWLSSLNGQINPVQFGLSEDIPVAGDYDGDAKADIAVFRPSNGFWYRLNSSDNQFVSINFGLAKDKPVPADYDGDGKTDIAVYRDGNWYLLQSSQGFTAFQFGIDSDKPVPADYDGDGKADAAVFRDGNWYLLQSTGGFAAVQFGQASDKPVPNAFIP